MSMLVYRAMHLVARCQRTLRFGIPKLGVQQKGCGLERFCDDEGDEAMKVILQDCP